MSALVIVESPAKAKTIGRFLGKQYAVEASYGHIRDLPGRADQIPERYKKEKWARLGVNIDKAFEPLYVIPDDKKKHVQRLKKALKGVDELLLATDEDREGESICWHVVEVLKPRVPVRRIAFHEITKSAVQRALEEPRDVAENLVRAQETRRILDRLFGYLLSPVLWKKVRRGLSAGRVQSVAVRLCVRREQERQAFCSAGYWGVEAELDHEGSLFSSKLARVGEHKVATGPDFDPSLGTLPAGSSALWLRDEAEARSLVAKMERPFTVAKVEERPQHQPPPPPFTTATLQQEANRKLGFGARHTMRVAQRLYEGVDLDGERLGLITYMRTDSVTLSELALGDAERAIRDLYGGAFTQGWRRYKTSSAGAQEAHEAIRPTEIGRTPQSIEPYLDRDELRLYEMIWKRTVASQMTDARFMRTAIEIAADVDGPDAPAVFTASGKRIEFPGFLRAYVEGSDDPAAEIADREVLLPPLVEGQEIMPTRIEPTGHETSPPPRYTEASLVKKLEAEGIGRPSTYATIIDTIQERGYIVKQGKALVPTFTAVAVNKLLEDHFEEYVDLKFTARMEQQLDEIATGELDPIEHLRRFYHGNGSPGIERKIAREEPDIDFPAIAVGEHPDTGAKVIVKIGRYGPYLQTGDESAGDRVMAPLPARIAPADLTIAQAVDLLEKKQQGPRCLGDDPETGLKVYVANGRYGPYVQLGETPSGKSKAAKPKRASLGKGMSEDEITLEQALTLLSLPRTLGVDAASGEPVIASVSRYGPFVRSGAKFRSLEEQDDVYTVGLERALELLAQPPRRRKGGSRRVLKELGSHPESGAAIQLIAGRYGPYITDGRRNASLPQGSSPEEMSFEDALKLLERRGKEPRRRRARAS